MQVPPELLNKIVTVLVDLVGVTVALLVAFWIGLVIWTFRDIRSRTRDVFAWILAILLVLIGGVIGWLLYFLLRPRETLAEVYDRQLEEEALLRDITTRRACPSCRTVTEPDWLICPHCRAELRRTCTECGRALELDWIACPYCMTPVVSKGRAGKPRDAERAPAAAATQPISPAQPLFEPYEEQETPVLQPVAEPVPQPATE
jgi:RNA polymerase subunit RPABC4/transcription elongation factor Spt4